MHHLLLYRWLLRGRVWLFLLLLQFAETEFFGHVISSVLRLKAHVHHAHSQGFHRGRVFGIQESHADCRRWVEFLFALFAQEVAHVHSDITKVDVHRTRLFTAVTHGTVVGHIVEFFKMLERYAATGLFFVQKRFGEQAHTQNLVARAVQQIRTRHMGGTHRLTFTTAQTVFHRMSDLADVRLLHDQGFHAKQFKRWCVSHAQIGAAHQFTAVKAACRIDLGFVIPKWLHFFVGQVFQLGDADAVLTRNHAIQIAGDFHDAVYGFVGDLQHLVIIGIHGDIGVHVAIARMHVQSHEHA